MRNDVIIIAHVRINEVLVLCYRPTGEDTDGPCHEGGSAWICENVTDGVPTADPDTGGCGTPCLVLELHCLYFWLG